MATTTLHITGMSCSHCVNAVEGALKAVPGVTNVAVNLEGNSATVTGGETAALIAAVTEEGYEATEAA